MRCLCVRSIVSNRPRGQVKQAAGGAPGGAAGGTQPIPSSFPSRSAVMYPMQNWSFPARASATAMFAIIRGSSGSMIAESMIRLGQAAEAKKTYQRLLKQYPQSEEAVRAAKRLQQL